MTGEALALAAEAAPRERRIGVLVVGSNSVRLMVFDGLHRLPVPLFNEKVMCGLGRRLGSTGRLDEEGVALAFAAVDRFTRLVEAMALGRLDVLATAAVREAEDGADFVAEIERRCGRRIAVLSGAEEARLSALGTISAAPDADGLMGDLGGGSLELVALDHGRLGSQVALPLGQLRLWEAAKDGPGRARAIIDEALASLPWLAETRGRTLYAIGGGWRALARVDMAQTRHPLRVIHGYTLSRRRATRLAETIAGLGRRELERLPRLPPRRLDLLPYAALALSRVLAAVEPEQVVFSAHGLRDGWLYDQLDEEVRRRDPLIEACRALATREGRFPEHGDELAQWTAPLFPGEGPGRGRLRLAACLLSELAWRAHPDHRADDALLTILWAPFVAIDHPGRALVALAVHARYAGRNETAASAQASELLGAQAVEEAQRLGLALRLGHTITGGAPGLLADFSLKPGRERLVLVLPRRNEALMGETVERRLGALARAMDLEAAIEVRT